MNTYLKTSILSVSVCAMVAAIFLLPGAAPAVADEPETMEKELHVHRLATTETAPYDAFVYLNRINTALSDGEDPKEFAGRLFGRLANQEGRVLLKLPPGFTPLAYDGLKVFYRTDGTARTGNCVSCHRPPEFIDGAKHVVDGSGTARVTATLRDVEKSAPYLSDESAGTLEDVLKQKIEMSAMAREGKNDAIDPEYKIMNITEDDIPALVDFLKTMNDGGKESFRDLVMNAEILDTSDNY